MKSIIALSVLTLSTLAFAHEGGHGTPQDPIAALPKVRTSQGEVFGVEGIIAGSKVMLALRSTTNEIVNPVKSGFKDTASAEVTFQGAAKALKIDVKAKGNAYEGEVKGSGEAPNVKLILTEAKGGKKQTVMLENVEQNNAQPHSHGGAKSHSH